MIPKNLIQIYLGDYGDESEYLFYLAEKWALTETDWSHKVYKNEEVDEIVRSYSAKAYEAYKIIPALSYRCDLARLILVHEIGGMYLDLDTRPNPDVTLYNHFVMNKDTKWGFCFEFLLDNTDAEGRPHDFKYITMNHVFIAEKGCPLIKTMIDSMVDQILEENANGKKIIYPDIVSTMAWGNHVKRGLDEILGADYSKYHIEKGYGPVGTYWVNTDGSSVKIKKFRNGIAHVGSIILKDFLDTNTNQHSLSDIASLYQDIRLHNGELKIHIKGGADGFPAEGLKPKNS